MVSTIRLGQWGYYALKPEKAGFLPWLMRHNLGQTKQMFVSENRRRFFSSHATKKTLLPDFHSECLFCLIGKGQYLACLVKCVGAKCTKRCCRVQQRSAQRCGFVFEVFWCGGHSSLLTPHSSLALAPAMRSEQFGAVHFTYWPTVSQYPMCKALQGSALYGNL